MVGAERFRGDVVFARQAVQFAHAVFDARQGFRVVFGARELLRQGVGAFVEVDGALFDEFGQRCEAGVGAGQLFGKLARLFETAAQGGFGVVDEVVQAVAGGEQVVDGAQVFLFAGQFGKFVFRRGDVVQFFQLIAQEFEFFGVRLLFALPLLPGFALLLPVLPGVAQGVAQGAVAAVAVKALALFVAFEEDVVFVLAVDAD